MCSRAYAMKKHYTIKELPYFERPYEKAEQYGVEVLSDAELLAVILRTGSRDKTSIEVAYDVLGVSKAFPGLLGLYHTDLPELMKLDGVGKVKALELLCVAELSKRLSRVSIPDRVRLRSPAEIAMYFMEELRSYESEHFYVALFDHSGRLIKYKDMFRGTSGQAIISTREAMLFALSYKATRMVILHNHPSGDPIPSPADDKTTKRFYQACTYLDLVLDDHIIIGDNSYISYAENRLFEKILNHKGEE